MKAFVILRKIKKLSPKEAIRLIESELSRAYDDGYSAGHEQQMKMRILDAQEHRYKESLDLFKRL